MRLSRHSLLIVLLALPLSLAAAGIEHDVPMRSLERPDQVPPILIAVGPTVGGSPDWDSFRFGHSGALMFRPASAAEFSGSFHDANLGLVLGWEWRRLAPERTLFAAGPTTRWYLRNMRGDVRGTSMFVGLGVNIASITYPLAAQADTLGGAADSTGTQSVTSTGLGKQRWFSGVIEYGCEYSPTESFVVVAKAQWRSYIRRPHDYSHWSLHLQVGVPLP